jgi:hypothetical protein
MQKLFKINDKQVDKQNVNKQNVEINLQLIGQIGCTLSTDYDLIIIAQYVNQNDQNVNQNVNQNVEKLFESHMMKLRKQIILWLKQEYPLIKDELIDYNILLKNDQNFVKSLKGDLSKTLSITYYTIRPINCDFDQSIAKLFDINDDVINKHIPIFDLRTIFLYLANNMVNKSGIVYNMLENPKIKREMFISQDSQDICRVIVQIVEETQKKLIETNDDHKKYKLLSYIKGFVIKTVQYLLIILRGSSIISRKFYCKVPLIKLFVTNFNEFMPYEHDLTHWATRGQYNSNTAEITVLNLLAKKLK